MLKKIIKILERLVFSTVLIYAYDTFNISSFGIIPINYINVLFVTIFGISGLLCLILFSFII